MFARPMESPANSLALLLVGIVLAAGCGRQPQLSPGNRHVLRTLRTAVLAKNREWLETNAKLIEDQHATAALSEEEYKSLQAVVEQARAGDWAAAKSAIAKLEQAQAPTAEELEQVKPRQSGP